LHKVAGRILLIHPPAIRPAEPPLGTAVLLSHLLRCGVPAEAIDANLEAYRYLLRGERLSAAAGPEPPTALRRGVRNAARAISLLRSPDAAASFPRYAAAARHLNAALSAHRGDTGKERLTLGDYVHSGLSEFSPGDLGRVASSESPTLFFPYFRDDLLPRVAQLAPRAVAITVNYRHQVLPAFELAGLLRRALPGVPVVGGGGMLTSWKGALIGRGVRLPAFSQVGFGPGEGALASLASGVAPGEDPFLPGSDDVEFLPEFGFAPLAEYLSPEPVLPVAASRGCYWRRCGFCPEAVTPTQPYRPFEAAAFPAMLRGLSLRYGVARFHLTDNAIPPATLRSIAARPDLLRGLSWYGFARFERELLDPGFAFGLAAAGCGMLQLGLESGSQALLDRMGKGTRVAEASAILANLKAAGIATYVYGMLGAPGETRGDAERTLEFLEEHAGAIDFLNLSILNLPREAGETGLPGGFGADEVSAGGEGEPLGLYRPVPPVAGWGRAQARRFLSGRILRSPGVRAIVARTPPWFTSSHAIFFRGAGKPAAAGTA